MQNEANRVSLGAVHTHTHTHTSTFRKIKRVANKATLFGVKSRLCVVLYVEKNVVLNIACFSCCLKILLEKVFLQQRDYADCNEIFCNYTNLKLLNKLEKQGGVA